LIATKGWAAPEVGKTYARARALCAQVGETPQLLPTLRGLWWFDLTRGSLLMAREFGEQLLRLAQREAEPTPRLEASAALGHTLFCVGDYAAALTCLEGIVLINPAAQGALELRHGWAAGVWCLALTATPHGIWAILSRCSGGVGRRSLRPRSWPIRTV
jgi:hypothetical protein